MVRKQISRFEALARRVVEGSVGRLVGNEGLTYQIAARLSTAVEESELAGVCPPSYQIAINPQDLRLIEAQVPELERRLARYVSALRQTGVFTPSRRAAIRLVPDETVHRGDVAVEASAANGAGETTSVLDPSAAPTLERLRMLDAFLIVNGRRHVALDKPLIKIGRRIDNDVIIDLPIVSRQHAHVRWRHGRFIIYDVGSRGGIQLNGERVRECVLAPGDLITLSERVPLIYGEGLENRRALPSKHDGTQDTQAFAPEDD
ncbi:MAG TPA: FHA domain-containing protein [Candidatus Binatia bacterium]|jgi:hypothetical protein|nr:FHA domain-containing protein [Candidatus Binatia bacterium]